jgi:hypothetical protein
MRRASSPSVTDADAAHWNRGGWCRARSWWGGGLRPRCFMAAVREIARPATGTDIAEVARDLTMAELNRAVAAHGITNVGPPMEQAEAERHLLSF